MNQDRPVVSIIEGKWRCPLAECDASYAILKSLRAHCQRKHQLLLEVKRDRVEVTPEERRARQREYTAKFRAKHAKRIRAARSKLQRSLFDTDDADKRGTYQCREALVEYKQSRIPNAGNGLFARQVLMPGDVVTWYSGQRSQTPIDDKSYTIEIESGYLIGIQIPKRKQGLGSFINREDRALPNARKNCEFAEYPGTAHYLYAEVTRKIKEGDELYVTYSRGYRIKN